MKRIIDGLQKIQIAIGGLFLLIFLVTVVYQIVCRYMGVAAMWTEDVSMYSFIWAVFMGAGAMVHSNAHFAFTSLMDSMKSEKKKICLQIVINIIVLTFCVLMVIYGYKAAIQFWNFRWINIPAMKRGPTWLCIPICGATGAIYLIYGIFDQLGKLMKGDMK
ncbi:MAG: TRAP transporter small permease subunit [Synergistaceae bacterium]|nr:TRAP transporter small permease subunit [Synergistaceae bacterium]MBQ6111477.1 TRAP transporter small permease subunit [Synergistaceae bacterium]MBQ9629583.1 TRAP transporter small permease subunit [Synergistaceae bacterium]